MSASINSKLFRNATMSIARELQGCYDKLGASPHQAVRNPLPMHKLVLTVLPKLPRPNDKISAQKTIKVTGLGRAFVRHQSTTESALDTLGSEFYKQNALSAEEVFAKLKAKGYIVRRGNVKAALNAGRWDSGSNVQSMTFKGNSQTGMRKQVLHSHYFVAA